MLVMMSITGCKESKSKVSLKFSSWLGHIEILRIRQVILCGSTSAPYLQHGTNNIFPRGLWRVLDKFHKSTSTTTAEDSVGCGDRLTVSKSWILQHFKVDDFEIYKLLTAYMHSLSLYPFFHEHPFFGGQYMPCSLCEVRLELQRQVYNYDLLNQSPTPLVPAWLDHGWTYDQSLANQSSTQGLFWSCRDWGTLSFHMIACWRRAV